MSEPFELEFDKDNWCAGVIEEIDVTAFTDSDTMTAPSGDKLLGGGE